MGRWMQKISNEGHTSMTEPTQPSFVGSVSNLSLQYTKKQATNDSPNQQKSIWLACVASLLGCSPSYLQEHDYIDNNDLTEQCSTAPHLVAQLIRSHPAWAEAKALIQHSLLEHH